MITPEDIREILERFGLKQDALADHLGVSQSNISKWLARKSSPGAASNEQLKDMLAAARRGDKLPPAKMQPGSEA